MAIAFSKANLHFFYTKGHANFKKSDLFMLEKFNMLCKPMFISYDLKCQKLPRKTESKLLTIKAYDSLKKSI